MEIAVAKKGESPKFAVGLKPEEDIPTIGRLARVAEENRFNSLFIIDSHIIMRELYVALTVSACRTKQIHLGPGVTNLLTRHATVTASALLSLNELSHGRAVLGIGAGDSALMQLGIKRLAIASLREEMKNLREMLSGNMFEYAGNEIRMWSSGQKIPIYLAGSGPKMLRLAPQIADGVIISVGSDISLLKNALKEVYDGAEELGIDHNKVYTICWVGASVSDDRAQAREEAKAFAARRAIDGDPKLRELYDYAEHLRVDSAHSKLVTEEMVDRFTVAGTPEDCLQKIKSLVKLGVDEIGFNLMTRRKDEAISSLGESVLSYFK